MKELRNIQIDIKRELSSLYYKQAKLDFQKKALIKLNEIFVHLYNQNTQQNPYLDFIYKFLYKNKKISKLKENYFVFALAATINFITALNNIDVNGLSDLSIHQKIQAQFYQSKNIIRKELIEQDVVEGFNANDNVIDNPELLEKNDVYFMCEFNEVYKQLICLNQLTTLIKLEEIINFYHKTLLKEEKLKIPLIEMINLDELTILTRKDVHRDFFGVDP